MVQILPTGTGSSKKKKNQHSTCSIFSAFRHFGGQRAQQDRGRGIAISLKAQSKSVEAGGEGGGGRTYNISRRLQEAVAEHGVHHFTSSHQEHLVCCHMSIVHLKDHICQDNNKHTTPLNLSSTSNSTSVRTTSTQPHKTCHPPQTAHLSGQQRTHKFTTP